MLSAKGEGTRSRLVRTIFICRCVSHRRMAVLATTATTNAQVNNGIKLCSRSIKLESAHDNSIKAQLHDVILYAGFPSENDVPAIDNSRLIWIDLEMTGLD